MMIKSTGPMLAALMLAAAAGVAAQSAQKSPLTGTAWQLVKFEAGDGRVLSPDDKSKYTLQFNADGRVAARIDCNRGSGAWKSTGSQLALGPMAVTRAMCPPGSLHDRIAKDLAAVRSYVLKNGHLFLSLMADGGVYEFEPLAPHVETPGGGSSTRPATAAPTSAVGSTGPVTFECTGGAGGPLTATFYKTTPALALLARGGVTRPAFSVRTASGARYDGQDVSFWEAGGEATVKWGAEELKCRKR